MIWGLDGLWERNILKEEAVLVLWNGPVCIHLSPPSFRALLLNNSSQFILWMMVLQKGNRSRFCPKYSVQCNSLTKQFILWIINVIVVLKHFTRSILFTSVFGMVPEALHIVCYVVAVLGLGGVVLCWACWLCGHCWSLVDLVCRVLWLYSFAFDMWYLYKINWISTDWWMDVNGP